MSIPLRIRNIPATFIGRRTSHGSSLLSSIQLDGSAEESVAMIRQWYRRTTLLSAVLFWMCCKRPVFGIATVNKNNDFNARLPVDLTINTFVRDHVLTEAWSSPPTLADSPDYFEDLALATTSSPGTWDDHARILFIDSELATGRVFGLVSAMMLLAIAVGVIVGIVSGDVDAGTAVSGAVVGIVAVFAGFVFWSR
ncbi:unnamed protein product [Zymoseptoria tritici ST99CH_1A5]|uniref:Uncharacterized protein n=3 Tax=Zymoseptoria tritici TaxID=1047171 RepID=A0A1X7RLU5_ZYMT9|nr:unnamed protein product [Zymoseptoria tritici ST99CH_3D7]SMR46736.1 unnamed protein product [Zymoseptoria tritici ST99CH_1E4]SMR47975.1 unnamed protein product [Zymoseptoria tritici ST99CH_3D1]SMY21881.1 unnamed protein product [Zymoseptoria tritici ST99CH_1A5]